VQQQYICIDTLSQYYSDTVIHCCNNKVINTLSQ